MSAAWISQHLCNFSASSGGEHSYIYYAYKCIYISYIGTYVLCVQWTTDICKTQQSEENQIK